MGTTLLCSVIANLLSRIVTHEPIEKKKRLILAPESPV